MLAVVFFARWDLLERTEARNSLSDYAGRTAVVGGTVAADPDRRATSVRAVVAVKTINGQDAPPGKLLVVLPREITVSYGERIEVRGRMAAPEAFETGAGRVFDYPGYLRVRGISMVMERAVLREQEAAGVTLFGALYALKHAFERSLESVVTEPEVSLLEGMLLGERGGFESSLLQAFAVVGLIHIVVLSGSNISIVAEGVFRLLGAARLPRAALYIVGFAAIVLFALMAGGGAATVRAVIMGSIAIVARYLRRPEAALRALVLAAVAMALWNPLLVLYDTGFVLSVLATFGLITLSPYIEQRLTCVPAWEKFNLRSIVASTLAVQLFLLPALLYVTGLFSLVSFPVNVLILPIVPAVMLAGFVTGVLGLIHPLAALLPALAVHVLLAFIIAVAEGAAQLPLVSFFVAPFPLALAVALYVPLTVVALKIFVRTPTS